MLSKILYIFGKDIKYGGLNSVKAFVGCSPNV